MKMETPFPPNLDLIKTAQRRRVGDIEIRAASLFLGAPKLSDNISSLQRAAMARGRSQPRCAGRA